LLVLLQSKVDFQHSPLPCDPSARNIRHSFSEFAKPVSSKGLCIEDIHLTSDDLEMYIDLAPFLNPSPYVVPEDMSLTKVYNLFRQLGLRHLFVVPRPSRVIGLITRKDLLIEVSRYTHIDLLTKPDILVTVMLLVHLYRKMGNHQQWNSNSQLV
jgi:chloride channel 7